MGILDLVKQNTKGLYQGARETLRPPPKLTVSQFAETHRQLSVEESPEPGHWRDWPYQTEMQNVFNEAGVRMGVFMTSSQIGKTSLIFNIIAYIVGTLTGGITFMLPSEVMAKDYSKARIGPLFRDCKILADKVPHRNKNGNTVLFKQWEGGYLRFVGSNNADKVSSFPSPWVAVDELDRCSVVARNSSGVVEGSSLDLLIERMKRFWRKFLLLTSTPTLKDTSLTYKYWLGSDQRLPLVACPHDGCGHEQFLAWEQFNWQGKDDPAIQDDAKSVHFVCKACYNGFTERDLPDFPPKVRWEAQNPKGEYPGFHINAFYTNLWEENLKKYLSCGKNQAKRMVFWNTTLGLPYSFEAFATPEWEELYKTRKRYAKGIVPSPACLLLAGCDVQSDRVEVTVAGINRKQTFIVDHYVLWAETSTDNVDDDVWQQLDDLLTTTWKHETGRELEIYRMAIDSRHNKAAVTKFARTRRKVVPVTGTPSNWEVTVLPAKRMEIKRNGKWVQTGKKRHPLGVNLIKMDVYGRLKLHVSEDEQRAGIFPTEYIHFPRDLSEEYYKQLTGEVCKVEEDKHGRSRYIWEPVHTDVEALDCLVYIVGLHEILTMHKWSDEKWSLKEAALGIGSAARQTQPMPIKEAQNFKSFL